MTRWKGIDVSAYQGDIDWRRVKQSGISFAIVRAGYGKYALQKDTKFDQNVAAYRSLKIPTGAYWYSYALSTAESEQEARACLAVLRHRKFALPIFLDIENATQTALSRDEVTAIAGAFCEKIQVSGYTAGIYSYQSFLETYLTEKIRRKYPIWVAQTGVSKPDYIDYKIWQYRQDGTVDGILGEVDLDYGYDLDLKETHKSKHDEHEEDVIEYTVRSGDTLTRIANKYGVTVSELVEWNDIVDPNRILVGQKLIIRKSM